MDRKKKKVSVQSRPSRPLPLVPTLKLAVWGSGFSWGVGKGLPVALPLCSLVPLPLWSRTQSILWTEGA